MQCTSPLSADFDEKVDGLYSAFGFVKLHSRVLEKSDFDPTRHHSEKSYFRILPRSLSAALFYQNQPKHDIENGQWIVGQKTMS